MFIALFFKYIIAYLYDTHRLVNPDCEIKDYIPNKERGRIHKNPRAFPERTTDVYIVTTSENCL